MIRPNGAIVFVLTTLLSIPAIAGTAPSGEAADHQEASALGGSAAVVAQFLSLSAEQIVGLERLLVERQQLAAPLQLEIAALERQLKALLAAGGSAESIGQVTLEIHARRQRLASIQADFLGQFVGQLGDEQQTRYRGARHAESLRPVLPAFRELHLF